MRIAIWLLAVLLMATMPASAGNRVALVIGNSAYQNAPLLSNPGNDASDIAAALQRLSFQVKLLNNATYDGMRRALIDFSRQAQGAEIAFVYFAGHGMEIGGENWLIPVDAQLETDVNVANEAIGLQSMTRAVSNTSRLGLVVLDACRSNPFVPKMKTTNVSRAVDRGFSRVEPTDNVLVAYSARDGTTAQDGKGRNSPFTRSLLKNIETPDLEVRFLFATVRDDVMADTHREQQPYIYGSLSKDMVYLKASSDTGVAATSSPSASAPVSAASPGSTTVAALPPTSPAKSADRLSSSAPPTAQRAVLYEDDPSNHGKQYVGWVTWSLETVKPYGNQSAGTAVRADIEIPDLKFKMTMSLRRNTDASLPASHTAELLFTLPPDFAGGGIANVPGILMKPNEQARGTPLAGLAVKVTDGFFLVGLSNVDADRTRNLELLKGRTWFDVPLVYNNQRRAIIAIEKGPPGEHVYAEAFTAWGQ